MQTRKYFNKKLIAKGSFFAALACCVMGMPNNAMAQNTRYGTNALPGNTGSQNSAFGYETLFLNTTGSYNAAIGHQVLYSNTSGGGNSAVGSEAMENNTTGYENNALGYRALRANTTGYQNSAVGASALSVNTLGGLNAASGFAALRSNTTGERNSALGALAVDRNITGSCNIGVGYLAGPSQPNFSNTIAIGCATLAMASNTAVIGNQFTTTTGGYTNWSNISDARVKKNVKENVPGIEFIKKLRPVTYTYDLLAYGELVGASHDDAIAREAKEQIVYTGFIAQEVEQAADELKYEFSGVDKPSNEHTPYALRYAEFVVPVVKATQEQQIIIEAQQRTIEALEHRLAKLERLLTSTTTGVEPVEGENSSSFIAYPNPSDGAVRVVLQGTEHLPAELQVYDAMGKLILSKRIQSGTSEALLDLSGNVSGSYIVTLVQGAHKASKVVVLNSK